MGFTAHYKQARQVVRNTLISSEPQTITSESVAIAAGAAGTVKDFYIANRPILSSNADDVGGAGDSSLTFATGVFDVEVAFGTADADLSNGEYYINYLTGKGRGKKKTTGTSESATYKVLMQNVDIDASGVTLTNEADIVKVAGEATAAANTARTTTTKVIPSQHIGANGSPMPSGVVTDPVYVKETSTGTDVVVSNATGAIAINTTTAIAAEFKLLKVTCHFSAAPTTSENLIIKLDSVAGSAYDTTLYSVNPSLSSATDIVYIPDGELKFKTGDEIVVTFTNTDVGTYGLSIYYQLI